MTGESPEPGDPAPRSVDPWPRIDELVLAGRHVWAVKLIRDEFGVGIHAAIDIMQERHDQLLRERPDGFAPKG